MQVLRELSCPGGVRPPEQYTKCLPAVAADDVAGAHIGTKNIGDVEQDFVSRSWPQPLGQGAESVELEEHKCERLAVAVAEVHCIFQLRHQGCLVEQTGEAVPVHHLPEATAARSTSNDRLYQDRGISPGRDEVIRAGSECRNAIDGAFLPHEHD